MKTGSSTFKITTRALGIVVALIGCTPKSVPVKQHDSARPAADYVEAPQLGADVKEFAAVDIGLLETQAKSSDPATRQLALGGLERFVLNGSYIEDSQYRSTLQMSRMLFAYNAAALATLKSEKDQTKNQSLLDKYYESVASGCDDDLKGCRNIMFFRQDNNSSILIQELAKRVGQELEAIKEPGADRNLKTHLYYRYLALAFDLKNSTRNRDLEFMYLSHARDYSDYFASLPDDAKKSYLLKRHTFVFETILNDFEPDLADPKFAQRFENFINAFSPWTYSKAKVNAFGDTASERMLDLAAANYIYADGPKSQTGKLSPSLAEAICRSQTTTIAEGENQCSPEKLAQSWQTPSEESCKELAKIGSELLSHRERALCLKKNHPDLFNGLHLTEVGAYDEYLYVVDRVFRGDWTEDASFWAGTRREDDKLLERIRSYLRIEVARMIVRTNAYMSSIYADRASYSSITLLKNAIDKSLEVSQEWIGLIDKVKILKLFMERQLKKSQSNLQSSDYIKTDELLNGLSRNIKFISVYPNMALMMYFMTEMNFEKEVSTFFGRIKIPASRFVGWLFSGQLPPLFNFGNDGNKISQLETLFSFYFTMKTETFNAFSVNNEKIDEVLFFKSVIGQYLDQDRVDLTDGLNNLNDLFNKSQTYPNFLSICSSDRQVVKNRQEIPDSIGVGRYTLSLRFEDIPSYTYLGAKDLGWTTTAFKFYEMAETKINTTIHQSLDKKLLFVDTMIELFRTHLKTMSSNAEKLTDASIEAKIAQIRKDLAPIQNARDEYLSKVYLRHEEISECLDIVTAVEVDREVRLLELEEKYLKSVYEIINNLRSGKYVEIKEGDVTRSPQDQANEELKTLNGSYLGADTLPKDYLPQDLLERNGYSYISGNQFFMSEVDVILRMRHFLKSVAPNIDVTMPRRFDDSDLYKKTNFATINLSEGARSAEKFIADAMRNYNGATDAAILRWPKKVGDTDWMTDRIKLITGLFKIGSFYVFDASQNDCHNPIDVYGLNPEEKAKVCRKVQVSGKDLVSELFNTAEIINLGTAEMRKPIRILVEKLGLPGLYQTDRPDSLFLDKESKEAQVSLGENLYSWITDDASDRDASQQAAVGIKNVGNFLFPPDKSVNDTILTQYCELAKNGMRTIAEFESAIRDRETLDTNAGTSTNIVYQIRNGRDLVLKSDVNGAKPIYLEQSLIDNTSSILTDWKNATSRMFKVDLVDRKLMLLPGTPCEADGQSP